MESNGIPVMHGVSSRSMLRLLLLVSLSVGGVGCKDLTGDPGLPAGTPNPTIYNTASGARGLRNGAIAEVDAALPQYVVDIGLLTDELEDKATHASPGQLLQGNGTVADPLDERLLPEGTTGGLASYGNLQNIRGAVNVALHALAAYDTATVDRTTQRSMRSELYALEGYAEILLADLFCSGVPLSTLDFQQDFTYAPRSTTTQVYRDALIKLDSASQLAAASPSDSIANLVRVLQGRAYLALGQYDSADAAVAGVPNAFQYRLTMNWRYTDNVNLLNQVATVSDREGHNGLPFRSSGDPRTQTTVICSPDPANPYNGCPTDTLYFPTKYSAGLSGSDYAPFVVGNGIEARLIQAEAALHAGNTAVWLSLLNQLRTTGVNTTVAPDTLFDTLGVTGCGTVLCGEYPGGNTLDMGQPPGFSPTGYSFAVADTTYPAPETGAPDGGRVQDYCNAHSWYEPCYLGDSMVVAIYVKPGYTQWMAGSGGVNGLAPLSDPGTDSGRVALLFQERAYWLFLTGHRQGDLRRLLRQYRQYPSFQSQSRVYPSGTYTAPGAGQYGTDVTVPIPTSEYANPNYHGCLDRNP